MDTLPLGFSRFFHPSEHAQRLRKKHRTLIIFVANLRRHAEQLRRSFYVAACKTGSRKIVVGIEKIGIDADRLLELTRSFVVTAGQRKCEPARYVCLRAAGYEFHCSLAGPFRTAQILFSCTKPLVNGGIYSCQSGKRWTVV